MSTTMTYGDYAFSPVPLVNISKEYLSTEDQRKVGVVFNMSLDGTLTPVPSQSGIVNNIDLMRELREGLNQDGCLFLIKCDDTVLWSGNPIVGDINFSPSNNNWVETVPYSVNLIFAVEGSGEDFSSAPYIESVNEDWSMEFVDGYNYFTWNIPTVGTDSGPYVLRMSHTVSAKGRTVYNDCASGVSAITYAKSYVGGLLSSSDDAIDQLDSSAFGLNTSIFTAFNHMRKEVSSNYAGTYTVEENWLVFGSGAGVPGNALEDFTVTITQDNNQNDLDNISINGVVEGLEETSYGGSYSVDTTKYDSALTYWGVVKNRLYSRCQQVYNTDGSNSRTLNTSVLNSSIGHNPSKGTINYSYTYDDRPSNCITGANFELIEIVDNNPTDVFAQLTILGRALGPILQDINTITASSRSVSIETVGPPAEGCTAATLRTVPNNIQTDVQTLLCSFETELTGTYDQVFKTTDAENWNPKSGRYSRSVSWTYQGCSITGTTALC